MTDRVPGHVAIEVADDPRLADYRQLKEAAARRRIEGDELFVAEGPVSIERAIESGHRIRSVLVAAQRYERLAGLLARAAAPVFVAPLEVLHEIVGFDLHRGAIAAADRRPTQPLDAVLRRCARVAVLEGLNDPENLGAVARSARAFGIEALLLDPTCIDPYTRRSVRVSMGEILFLPVWRAPADDWPEAALAAVAAHGFEVWTMTPQPSASDIWSLSVPAKLAIVVGAEGPGLQRRTLAAGGRRVRIPITTGVDSLNVAAAAAVAFAVVGRPSGSSC